jgi:hypothetical protein
MKDLCDQLFEANVATACQEEVDAYYKRQEEESESEEEEE